MSGGRVDAAFAVAVDCVPQWLRSTHAEGVEPRDDLVPELVNPGMPRFEAPSPSWLCGS